MIMTVTSIDFRSVRSYCCFFVFFYHPSTFAQMITSGPLLRTVKYGKWIPRLVSTKILNWATGAIQQHSLRLTQQQKEVTCTIYLFHTSKQMVQVRCAVGICIGCYDSYYCYHYHRLYVSLSSSFSLRSPSLLSGTHNALLFLRFGTIHQVTAKLTQPCTWHLAGRGRFEWIAQFVGKCIGNNNEESHVKVEKKQIRECRTVPNRSENKEGREREARDDKLARLVC